MAGRPSRGQPGRARVGWVLFLSVAGGLGTALSVEHIYPTMDK